MAYRITQMFVLASWLLVSAAHATLQVFPTHVLLSDKNRTAQLALRHIGDAPAKYRISVVYYKMKPDGGMAIDKTPGPEDKFAEKYFRYSPRQVQLQPNVEQVVRVILRKPADL